jgi:hypothetical protein
MIRPLLSLKRLFFDETEGKVRYQYAKQGSQEEPMDYLESICKAACLIVSVGFFSFLAVGLAALAAILSFRVVSGWKLGRIG